MAFVAVLPTAGTIIGGLGAAASSIPIIGSVAAPVLGGLGGGLTALGAGNLAGAATSIGSGLLGGGAGLYTGADKLLGGFLPNLGGGIGISPADGFLGKGGLGLFGGPGQPFGGPATAQVYGVNPFDTVDKNPFVAQQAMDQMAQNELIAKGFMDAPVGALGTGLGALNKLGATADVIKGLLPQEQPAAGVFSNGVNPRQQGGGIKVTPRSQTPLNRPVNLAQPPGMMVAPGAGAMSPGGGTYVDQVGKAAAQEAAQRAGGVRSADPRVESLKKIHGGRPTTMGLGERYFSM